MEQASDGDECVDQLAQAQDTIEHLRVALDSSRHIGAAVGIVMAAQRCTESAAIAQLKTQSQNTNRKLRDIADDVVSTGLLEH